jgi:hypothetical protein
LFHFRAACTNVRTANAQGKLLLGGYCALPEAVNPIFEPNQSQAGRDNAEIALLFPLQSDDAHHARVISAQQLLFPITPYSLCQELGLHWWTALKLHSDGWLSFPPDRTPQLDEAQEAELRFVGALVIAGCDHNMLALLLNSLHKPYPCDLKRLFFDWSARRWRMVPQPSADPEAIFADWLDVLVETGNLDTLTGIAELARDALARVHASLDAPHPQPDSFPNWHVTTDGEETQG